MSPSPPSSLRAPERCDTPSIPSLAPLPPHLLFFPVLRDAVLQKQKRRQKQQQSPKRLRVHNRAQESCLFMHPNTHHFVFSKQPKHRQRKPGRKQHDSDASHVPLARHATRRTRRSSVLMTPASSSPSSSSPSSSSSLSLASAPSRTTRTSSTLTTSAVSKFFVGV